MVQSLCTNVSYDYELRTTQFFIHKIEQEVSTMIKKTLMAASVLSLALAGTTAHAQSGYVSASVGQADYDISGFDEGTSFKLTGGMQINENFALEGSYINFGEAEDDIAPVWTAEATGFNLAAVGTLPINEKFDVFGKVGMLFWDAELSEEGFGTFAEDDGNDLGFGFGASFNPSEQVSIIAEYEMFEVADEDLNNLSLGVRVNF